jgi:hypothetical protein
MVNYNWMNRLKMYLVPLGQNQSIQIWDDSKIKPGSLWEREIEEALDNTKTAILLVGPGYLASDFVMKFELPRLLNTAKEAGTTIFPLIVGHCAYNLSQLQKYQSFNSPKKPLETLDFAEQNKVLNDLAISISESLSATERVSSSDEIKNKILKAIQNIYETLQATGKAFEAQLVRRNDLESSIEKRLGFKNKMEYEKFFFKYYPELNRDEKFIFDLIRNITETQLYPANKRIVEIMVDVPQVTELIPELTALRQHLIFWLNKYEGIFVKNSAMCLLYTGVEDGVEFPPGIEDKVRGWIDSQS